MATPSRGGGTSLFRDLLIRASDRHTFAQRYETRSKRREGGGVSKGAP